MSCTGAGGRGEGGGGELLASPPLRPRGCISPRGGCAAEVGARWCPLWARVGVYGGSQAANPIVKSGAGGLMPAGPPEGPESSRQIGPPRAPPPSLGPPMHAHQAQHAEGQAGQRHERVHRQAAADGRLPPDERGRRVIGGVGIVALVVTRLATSSPRMWGLVCQLPRAPEGHRDGAAGSREEGLPAKDAAGQPRHRGGRQLHCPACCCSRPATQGPQGRRHSSCRGGGPYNYNLCVPAATAAAARGQQRQEETTSADCRPGVGQQELRPVRESGRRDQERGDERTLTSGCLSALTGEERGLGSRAG